MSKGDLLIKKSVALFKEKAGFADADPVDLPKLLVKLNVMAVFRPLSDSFSGMAVKINNLRFIMINSNHPIGRQNFTIGHELYHLFEQKEFYPHICSAGSYNKKNKEEFHADLFATYLLMPEDGLLKEIQEKELNVNKIKTETLLNLEQKFGVSHLALLYRLFNLNIITLDFLEQSKSDVIKSAEKFGYDTTLYKPGNEGLVIGNYEAVTKQLFEKEKISEAHSFELLDALKNVKGY